MAWERLAHVELGVAGDTIDSGTFTAKKNLKVIAYTKGANTELQFRFNSDSGSNYASRRSGDGGSDSTFTSQTQSKINATGGASTTETYMTAYITNISDEEKLVISDQVASEATGAGTAPRRSEGVTKWANTSTQITSIQLINNGSGDFAAGSYITVLGAKEAATADVMTVDGFTAKKHLMIQYKGIRSGDIIARLRLNNDSGNNYAQRLSDNGAADSTNTSQSGLEIATSGSNNEFSTIYVINEASKEKLIIAEITGQNTAGAGNAPRRRELTGKWANTSNAVTRVDFVNTSTGDFAEGSEVTVYGTD